tara:strand:- start:487 stop:852 length:366 start_codon:yes stop_codon:yes gene_type:complete
MKLKHLKTKKNYGYKIQTMSFEDLKIGKEIALDAAPRLARFNRFYTLLKQEIVHPILVFKDQLYNGGLRVAVAIEKGYDSIDAVILEDEKLLKKLRIIQQQDAHNYFPKEQLEGLEILEGE